MKNQLYALVVTILFIIPLCTLAQNDSANYNLDDRNQSIKQLLGDLKGYHIGHYGTTQNCVAYDVYALKYKWYWFLFIKQEDNISLMMVRPPLKGKNIDYPSKFFTEGLARAFFHKYITFKKRRKKVIDMHIYGFYKLNRFGRRSLKNLLLLEYPYYNKGFLKWQLNEEKAKEKAEKKAAKEIAKQAKIDAVESIKPTISKAPIEAK